MTTRAATPHAQSFCGSTAWPSAFKEVLLITCVLVSMQRLNATQTNFEIRRQSDIFEVNRKHVLVMIEREVDLTVTVIRCQRRRNSTLSTDLGFRSATPE